MVQIDIAIEDKDKLFDFIRALKQGGLVNAGGHGLYGMSRTFARVIYEEYKNYRGHQHHALTQAVYAIGKRPGKTPEKLKWPGARPMNRSGLMARAVTVYNDISDTNARFSYIVGINTELTYAALGGGEPNDAGKSVAALAHQLEFPRPFTIRVTKEMLSYLNILWNHMHGGSSKDRSRAFRGTGVSFVLNSTIVIFPKPRPVWSKAVAMMQREAVPAFTEHFVYRLTKLAKNPSGEVPRPPMRQSIRE